MIQIYPKGQTDFSLAGITLHPTEATVTFQENGQFDFEMVVPANAGYTDFDYGKVLRVTVPKQERGAVSLGTVSYYTVSNPEGTTLYAQIPTLKTISYKPWNIDTEYAVGTKVSHSGKNYQCNYYDETSPYAHISPDNCNWWTEIPRTSGVAGKVITTVAYGASIMKTGDFNTDYMEAATLTGYQGYIKIADCTATGDTEERVIPAKTITEQSFTITDIRKEQNGQTIRVTAEHISYQLGRTMLGDCNVIGVNPQTALMLIAGAMKEAYAGGLYTNIDEPDIESDFSWKNAQQALMDPKSGLIALTGGQLIRDDLDVFIVPEEEQTARYSVRYGVNLKNVRWTGSVDALVTRVYPTAQHEDGRTLLLPEEYIDSVRDVPFVKPKVLNTGLKVGQEIENSDGTKTTLTEQDVLTRMRDAATNRFTVDKCDMADVKLELDWVHMPDTAEYAQYTGLINVWPGEWVQVTDTPLGVSELIRLTGYNWDPILCRYKSTTFGSIKTRPTVAGYNLQTGSVSSRVIAPNSIGGQNIQAGSITAREIEAGSITADKIASREITAELIQANTITANEIAAGTITAEEIHAGAITAEKIAAGAIQAGHIAAGAITAIHIAAEAITADKIQAGAITAVKIAAGAITTEKLDAYAVTAAKIAAGAVTADKIAAGSISADKIDTTDLTAINATLGTASIAQAEIATADINYAHIVDLDAQSAFFGQAIFEEAVGGKLYVPRLSVGYAQMLGATIGDLVIQASNGNYYRLDVDLDGDVTATQMTPTAEEIEQGYTEDGRTIYMGTDITASDLNTTNIYASHALMDEITANIINVDKLFAREATISKINALDLSSNTYIQATIGTWQSGSTITQTINSINTRISSLGYGTFFYSETEPSHENLVIGDVWIQPVDDHTWDDIAEYTWDELSGWTWDQVAGEYRMYVWTGEKFKLLYDNLIISELQTQINQNAYAITLKADQSAVNTLSGEVTQFAATLEVQAQEIQSAVSAVTSKTANYTGLDDPSQDPQISLSPGDTWTKTAGDGTWGALEDYTWDELAALTWDELAGASVYTWTGSEWLQTSDYGAIVQSRTIMDQTSEQVTVLAQQNEMTQTGLLVLRTELSVAAEEIRAEAVRAQGAELQLNASISLTAEKIQQEVERATLAEGGKIDKTVQYQTADAIVSEAVRLAASSASDNYIAKTTIYQSADEIIAAAEAYTEGYAYAIRSGIAIVAAGIEVSGATYIKIKSGGKFLVDSGNFSIDDSGNVTIWGTIHSTIGDIGGFNLANNSLSSGSGVTYMNLNSNASNTYAIWVGNETAASAPFRLKRSGALSLTKLLAIAEDNTETEVNLRTVGLWKLNYATVKAVTVEGNTLTIKTTAGETSVNFIRASSLAVGTDGAGYVNVTNAGSVVPNTSRAVTAAIEPDGKSYSGGYERFGVSVYFSSAGGATIKNNIPCVIKDGEGDGLAYDAGVAAEKSRYSRLGYFTLYRQGTGGVYVSVGYHDWYYRS